MKLSRTLQTQTLHTLELCKPAARPRHMSKTILMLPMRSTGQEFTVIAVRLFCFAIHQIRSSSGARSALGGDVVVLIRR